MANIESYDPGNETAPTFNDEHALGSLATTETTQHTIEEDVPVSRWPQSEPVRQITWFTRKPEYKNERS